MTATQSRPGHPAFDEAIGLLTKTLTKGRSDQPPTEPSGDAVTHVEALAELCMYSQALPVMTPQLVDGLNANLPSVIQELAQLQPARKGFLQEFAQSTMDGNHARKSAENPFATTPGERPATLEELLRQDLTGPERNPVALVALAVSAMAFGYAVGHTWAK
ncbi:hypothetical protein ACWFRB_19105 [Rhodococcus sp. NPDC055112]